MQQKKEKTGEKKCKNPEKRWEAQKINAINRLMKKIT